MNINAIEILPISPQQSLEAGLNTQPLSGNFQNWLSNEMAELNNQIISSENKLEKLATGEFNNLHDVMISLEKAKLSFQLALQVRNKLLEGYQEIMRMQI